jgi:hypothetical protein
MVSEHIDLQRDKTAQNDHIPQPQQADYTVRTQYLHRHHMTGVGGVQLFTV